MQAVTRGKLRQIATAGGDPVDVTLYACVVTRAPYVKGGKTYAGLDASAAAGDLDLLRRVDEFVRRQANPAFSPVAPGGKLVVKLAPGLRYENGDGDAALPWNVTEGAVVDVVLRPGAFGDFGYCLLLRRVKPHVERV